jgi:1,4-dihydroxy-2-naphthoate octaprenyltransferase
MSADVISRSRSLVTGTRMPFSSASVLPAILGAVWGWVYRPDLFGLLPAAVAVAGVFFLHLAANTINDYYDWDMTDRVNRFPTPFSGGSRSRLEKVLSRGAFLHMAIVFYALALAAAAALFVMGRPLVLAIGTLGALCGFLYSARPVSFQSRGMGELTIFLAFGPLITVGMGYAACGVFTPEFFAVGIPNGLVVANILWVNEFPDVEADASEGKRNLVVRLGTARARYGYLTLLLLFYLTTLALVAVRLMPLWTLLVLLTVPLCLKSLRHLWKTHDSPLTVVPAQAGTIQFQILTTVLAIICVVADRFV